MLGTQGGPKILGTRGCVYVRKNYFYKFESLFVCNFFSKTVANVSPSMTHGEYWSVKENISSLKFNNILCSQFKSKFFIKQEMKVKKEAGTQWVRYSDTRAHVQENDL